MLTKPSQVQTFISAVNLSSSMEVSTVVHDLNGMDPSRGLPAEGCRLKERRSHASALVQLHEPSTLVCTEVRVNSDPVVHPHLGDRTGSRGRRRRSAGNGRKSGCGDCVRRGPCVGLESVDVQPTRCASLFEKWADHGRKSAPFVTSNPPSLSGSNSDVSRIWPNLRLEQTTPHLPRYSPRESTRQPFLHLCPSTTRP